MAVDEYELTDAEALSLLDTYVGPQVVLPGYRETDWHLDYARAIEKLARCAVAPSGLQVVKDEAGDLKISVRAGRYLNGDTAYSYVASGAHDVVDDATNYVYLIPGDSSPTINQSAFPDPSATPHIRLATVATGTESEAGVSGEFAWTDITDYRGTALLAVAHGIAAAALQDALPTLELTGTDGEDGTGEVAIQLLDGGGNALAARALIRCWIAASEYGAPAAQTDFSVLTGTEVREITADAYYEVLTDATGLVEMDVTAGDGTYYVMAEVDGVVYTGQLTISGN